MKNIIIKTIQISLLLVVAWLPRQAGAQQDDVQGEDRWPFKDTSLTVQQRVEDLLGRLTLDEKLSLMEHGNPAIDRLGIKPYSWWNEALHGVARNGIATVFPMPIALAASFDPDMVQEVYRYIAHEAVRKNKESNAAGEYGDYTGLTFFTPNINIFRDPRWGRGMETFGEDPYLTARMGLAAVNGLQGAGVNRNDGSLLTAACLKHLAVHSGPEGLRHQFDARVSGLDLWSTYLPAFEYIIKHSDVQQVMCGYNRLNGEPCCTNSHLLMDILRNRWGYNGIVVTDCWALNDCWEPDTVILRHRTHPTAAAAAAAAFGSEVDLECGSGLAALRTAVDSGYIPESVVDIHLRRLLTTRMRIRPERFASSGDNYHVAPVKVAEQSLVMLKNNGVLPLQYGKADMKYAIVGPNAADSAMLLGNYNGTPSSVTTVLGGFRQSYRLGILVDSRYPPQPPFDFYFDTACHLVDNGYRLPDDFWQQIGRCDVVVFCGGLSPALEGEELQVDLPGFYKGDRTAIELPAVQRDMIKAIRRHTDKPIVLLLSTGSAIALDEVVDDVDAIVVTWYGGEAMGTAVVNTLFGNANNFGRLPVTFYRSTAQLPPFDDYNMQGRTYRYMTETPLYPYGYGLSYGHSHYDSLRFDRQTMTLTGAIVLDSVDNRVLPEESKEVVQVYLSTPTIAAAPRRQLVELQSCQLALPERPRSSFSITIEPEWLRYYNPATDSMEPIPDDVPIVIEVGTPGVSLQVVGE